MIILLIIIIIPPRFPQDDREFITFQMPMFNRRLARKFVILHYSVFYTVTVYSILFYSIVLYYIILYRDGEPAKTSRTIDFDFEAARRFSSFSVEARIRSTFASSLVSHRRFALKFETELQVTAADCDLMLPFWNAFWEALLLLLLLLL